ncbi:MAG: hypothetical protein MJ237_06820 [bacterium]|nr:hypothetical protein [bacterium]
MKRICSFLLILLLTINASYAELTLDEVNSADEIFYRFGTTDIPEKKFNYEIQPDVKPIVQKEVTIKDNQPLTYADLSIKKMSLEISQIIESDYDEMQNDLSLLWQGAATNSDTIKFAIYKLSNPDKDKPDSNAVKKVLTTIAGMSTFIGAGMGNPMLASAALIGGNTLGIMSQDTKALNYKYTQVTDADMILLVRKVEDLQQKVVDMYYDYISARQLYNMTSEMVKKSYNNYLSAQNLSKEVVLMTDTFYREAQDENQRARGQFFEKRARLEQLVGNDIFKQFETNIDGRYSIPTE